MGEYHIGAAIQQFLEKSRIKQAMQAYRIEDMWEEIMGKTVAKYTDSIQIHADKLYINTSVAPLKNELLYQKQTIIQRVNEAFGKQIITDVVIK